MKKQFTILLILIGIGVISAIPKVNAYTIGDAVINSISPIEVASGDELTIYGSGFNDTRNSSNVYFGGYTSGTIISWSDTQIVVKVPSHPEEYFYINDCGANMFTCKRSANYPITIKPKISYLSLNIRKPGEYLTINGDNFGFDQGSVYIGGEQADISSWSPSSIGVIVPNIENGNVNVEIKNSKGITSNSISLKIISDVECTNDSWSCGSWSSCSSNGNQTRTCNKISNCEGGTQSPTTTQFCSYAPACSADTWQCGNWGTCSPQGIQARSCNKTYDCSSAETAAPATSQYCEAPNQPKQQTPSEDLGISNQDTIIKATVKLVCPVSSTMASQGSGTIINTSGLILTNKHVIDGTSGCLVGFIDDYDDEPYFGDRQIADIYKISSDADVAVLKLRNPKNNNLASINISQNSSSNIKLGEILTTYGYPAMFGKKITYTSGDFSGVDGNYLKTTAVIEHGNSGGGAYLKNGAFIGIPTAVVKGSLNSMGYLLSVDKVNSWLNNSTAYNGNNNNNDYSRVSALLENIDLGTLDSLGLFVTGDKTNDNATKKDQKSAAKIDKTLSKRLTGKLLLQVEQGGSIWYVDTKEFKRYSVTWANALPLFVKLSLGISNANLEKIPIYGSGQTGSTSMGNRLKGKLLLQVEQGGNIWYVDQNGYRHSVTWNNLMDLFTKLSLGITNANLDKIEVGSLE